MIRFLIKCKFLCNSKRIKNNVTQKKVERNEKTQICTGVLMFQKYAKF